MSAPDTNVEKQERRHAVPLTGMGFAVAFALILLLGLVFWVSSQGNVPEGAEAQVDGRTGEVTVTE